MVTRPRILGLTLALCSTLPVAAQRVWRVAASGPADFTTIQAAVDIAAPRDEIRVAAGSYAGFVADKTLRILGTRSELPAGRTTITSDVVVRDIGTGEGFVMTDLALGDGRLTLSGCSGPVLLSNTEWAAGRIVDSTQVSLDQVSFFAGLTAGVLPLEVENSRVLLQSCSVIGPFASGGSSIVFTASGADLLLRGGAYQTFLSPEAGPIGELRDGSAVLWSGGRYGDCAVGEPCDASFVLDGSSTAQRVDLVQPELVVERNTQLLRLTLRGAPQGSLVLLAASLPAAPIGSGPGAIWLDPPSLIPLLLEPADDPLQEPQITLPIPISDRIGFPLTLQSVLLTVEGAFVLSSRGMVMF